MHLLKASFLSVALVLSCVLLPFQKGMAQSCSFSLGNDTSICQGIPINFNIAAPSGATAYLWDNATTTAIRQITGYGTYYCKLTKNGVNVVSNGNFSAGNTGFTSSYIQGPTGSPWGTVGDPGTYAITTNANLVHNNFASFTNHTAGGGGMMVINGASVPNVSIWCQNIVVTPNTDYNFSTWVTSCESGQPASQLAQLQFSINGGVIGTQFSPNATAGSWTQFNATWNSGSSTTASICIVNQNTAAAGNDFAIDDIFFQPICVFTDTLHVDPKPFPIGYNAGVDAQICKGSSTTLIGNAGNGTSFAWSSLPAGFSSTNINPSVNPNDTTKYILTSDLNGCKKLDTVVVFVIKTPSPNAGFNDTICEGKSVTLNGNPDGGSTFNWTSIPPGFVSSLATPTLNPLSTADYILTSSTNFCVATDTVKIVVNVSPLADFSMVPADSSCNSYSIAFINNSTNSSSFVWEFGDGEISADPIPVHTYTSQNLFQIRLTAKNTGCSSIRIEPIRISFSENSLFIPNSFTPNSDLRNDLFYIPKGCLSSLSISIYDRWGQLVKKWEDLNGFWDGRIGGLPAQEGIYVYTLDGFFLSGEKSHKIGTITLYR